MTTTSRSVIVTISGRGGGDWPPVVAVAVGLRDRGHRVTVLCDAATAAAVRSTGLPIMAVPRDHEQDAYMDQWIRELVLSGGHLDSDSPNPIVGWAVTCMPLLRDTIRPVRPDVVVGSLFCMGLADLLAAELRIPWCFVNPSFYFGEDSRRPWDADFAGPNVAAFRYFFSPLAQKATMVLHATDPAFDVQPERLPEQHHYVGPLIWEAPAPSAVDLNGPEHPWALITLSSVPQEGELSIARAALAALEFQPVTPLVTLAPGHARDELAPVPRNARVVGYVPHGAVLKRACLVVSHAGHGIVMKALYHGVPMVLVPWDRDQPGVAARAEALGVAAVVSKNDCHREQLAAAIGRVLGEPIYRQRARLMATALQARDPVAEACAHIEHLCAGPPANIAMEPTARN